MIDCRLLFRVEDTCQVTERRFTSVSQTLGSEANLISECGNDPLLIYPIQVFKLVVYPIGHIQQIRKTILRLIQSQRVVYRLFSQANHFIQMLLLSLIFFLKRLLMLHYVCVCQQSKRSCSLPTFASFKVVLISNLFLIFLLDRLSGLILLLRVNLCYRLVACQLVEIAYELNYCLLIFGLGKVIVYRGVPALLAHFVQLTAIMVGFRFFVLWEGHLEKRNRWRDLI